MHTFVVLVIAVHKTIKQWLIVSGQFYLFMLWWIMVFFCVLKWTKRRPVWYWNCWVWPHSLSKANQQIKNKLTQQQHKVYLSLMCMCIVHSITVVHNPKIIMSSNVVLSVHLSSFLKSLTVDGFEIASIQ